MLFYCANLVDDMVCIVPRANENDESKTIVTNALPRIASDFHALAQITWIPTAVLLTQASVPPAAAVRAY